jgi:beta-lactamase class A
MRFHRGWLAVVSSLAFVVPAVAPAQTDSLKNRIEHALEPAQGRVGVAVVALEDSMTLMIDGNGRFPMQSVVKFPLALAVLREVDRGTFSLNQKLHLTEDDLLPDTWSPLRKKYPGGNVSLTLDEVLRSTVSLSDNNGCDILFRLVGGPSVVNDYVHSLGIPEIVIVATEEEMQKDRESQRRNWSTPAAMGQLLYAFSRGDLLSQCSRDYLWELMVETATGPRRIKGHLPEGTVVAHKTGSSGTDSSGIALATNDVGIVQLPDGRHVALVVYVADSAAEETARDEVIATIARLVWDAYAR